jgi:NADPH2:quinone reductase
VNPSDVAFIEGRHPMKRALPAIPGWEGSGVVVAAGGGFLGRRLVGKRVAASDPDRNGFWAEYTVMLALHCLTLPDNVDDEHGAMALINPLTALGLLEQIEQLHARAFVQTAGASGIGRMVCRLARRKKIAVINVVRREEQVQMLRAEGETYVLNSSGPDFDANLASLAQQLEVRLAIDPIAGDMCERLLNALPRGSRVILYGNLSEQPCTVWDWHFSGEGKSLEGFFLADWFESRKLPTILRRLRQVRRLLSSELSSDIRARLPLADVPHRLHEYAGATSGGKVIVVP